MLSDAVGDLLISAAAVALSPIPVVAVVVMLGTPRGAIGRDLVAVGEHAGVPIRGYSSGLHPELLVSGADSQGAKASA